jgi:hypothetical protein
MMGNRTPNIDRIGNLHRLLRSAILHLRARRLHHRSEPDAHRPSQGRLAGSQRAKALFEIAHGSCRENVNAMLVELLWVPCRSNA